MQFLRSVCYNSFQVPHYLIRFFTNRAKSVTLFYSEVFFLNLLSQNSLYLNYTRSFSANNFIRHQNSITITPFLTSTSKHCLSKSYLLYFLAVAFLQYNIFISLLVRLNITFSVFYLCGFTISLFKM